MIKSFLDNTALILFIAVVMALIFPSFSIALKPFFAFFVIATIAFSTISISTHRLNPLKNLKQLAIAIFFNYAVQGILLLILAFLFIKNFDYFTGFVVLAAAPVTIAVVPFTYVLRGNVYLSTMGSVIIYLLAVLLMPTILLLFFAETINPVQLLYTVAFLLLLPLALSRMVRRIGVKEWKYADATVNVVLGIVIYTLIAVNHSTLTNFSDFPFDVLIVFILKSFVFGTIIFLLIKNIFSKKDAISYTLFSISKSNSLAATVALILFTEASTLPTAFGVLFNVLFIIYFSNLFKRFN